MLDEAETIHSEAQNMKLDCVEDVECTKQSVRDSKTNKSREVFKVVTERDSAEIHLKNLREIVKLSRSLLDEAKDQAKKGETGLT